jgi:hypothetical protein
MQDLVTFQVEAGQIWEESEKLTIQQAALDIGTAIARDINRIMEQSLRLGAALTEDGEELPARQPIEPDVAFLKVFGRPVTFLRKANAVNGFWGQVRLRDLIWVHSNAPHFAAGDSPATVGNRPQFSVHELGHAFENVLLDAIGQKLGRNSLPANLVNRPNGFFPSGRFQQSKDLGRGEIFADMFIGWVYDRWQPINNLPDGLLTDAATARKKFMDDIMVDLIQAAISHNNNP